jgi:hypothetical protein
LARLGFVQDGVIDSDEINPIIDSPTSDGD